MTRVGMIGLGNIGAGVARNLVADGHDVVVCDTDPTRLEGIDGAASASDPAEVGDAAEITLLSLPTPDVVEEVARTWARGASTGDILIDLSTNSPERVRHLGAELTTSGHHLVEAPLTGGAPGAAKRMLVFMIGGDDEPVRRALGVLEPLGRAAFHLGPLGAGNTMKLVNSLIAFTATWSSLEGLSLVVKEGIDLPAVVEVIRTAGAGNFWIDRMAESVDVREGPTNFAIALAAKDAGLVVDAGESLGVPTPFGATIAKILAGAVDDGFGERDWRALVEVAEAAAQVELRWADRGPTS